MKQGGLKLNVLVQKLFKITKPLGRRRVKIKRFGLKIVDIATLLGSREVPMYLHTFRQCEFCHMHNR